MNTKCASLLYVSIIFFPIVSIADSIDNYLQCKMSKLKIPGLSLAIVKDGQIIKTKGYGFANVELKSPANSNTIYQSGSIGKQFTATLTMMLVEKGLLHLDDHVNQYLTDAPESWKNITIKNLLTHTSGLKRDIPWVDLRLDYTDEQLLQKLYLEPLNFEPGTKWEYSNSAYEIIGIILKKITKKTYGNLLLEKIFKPLEMNTAQIINERNIIPNRASGYDLVNGVLKNQEYVSPTFNSTADGALYFTVLDLAKWDAALYTTKLMKQENMALLWTPVRLKNGKSIDYGLGWRLNHINGQYVIEHAGEWQGFTAFISRYINKKLTVIIMTNLSGNAELGKITHNVAAIYEKNPKDVVNDNCT